MDGLTWTAVPGSFRFTESITLCTPSAGTQYLSLQSVAFPSQSEHPLETGRSNIQSATFIAVFIFSILLRSTFEGLKRVRYKQSNKVRFLYVFILKFFNNSTRFERPFRSSSGVHDLLYSVAMYKPCYRAAEYSKSWTPDERNSLSKHVELYKNCRIHTYRKCTLLVCLYNWLRCTVHTTSKVCGMSKLPE